jgi:hypothetical protein
MGFRFWNNRGFRSYFTRGAILSAAALTEAIAADNEGRGLCHIESN